MIKILVAFCAVCSLSFGCQKQQDVVVVDDVNVSVDADALSSDVDASEDVTLVCVEPADATKLAD
jgi:hypothetical protein